MYLIDLGCYKDVPSDRDFPNTVGTFVHLQDDQYKTQARAECINKAKSSSTPYTYIGLQRSTGECFGTTASTYGKHGACDDESSPTLNDIFVSELASLSTDGTYG